MSAPATGAVAASGVPTIRCRGVGKVFRTGGREVTALQGFDLDVAAGEFVCLLGPSGCGKSTLLNAVAGFDLPTAGELTALGRPVVAPGPERGHGLPGICPLPLDDSRTEHGFRAGDAGRTRPRASASVVDRLLAKLGLSDFRDRFPKDLSGGMRQRVAIARVLASIRRSC